MCVLQPKYEISYVDYLLGVFSAAEQTDAAAIMPWQLVPFHTTAAGYDFGIDDAAFGAVAQMVQYYHDKARPGPVCLHVTWEGFDHTREKFGLVVVTDGSLRQWRLHGCHPGARRVHLL